MATALVLLVAANSALSGFPRLLYFIARDGYAPRAFLHLGDRLAFSVGIIALTVPAAAVYVASDAVPSLAGGDLAERQDVPGEINHLVVVPVAALDLASLRALAYAASLGVAVLAVHVCPSDREDERFRRYWRSGASTCRCRWFGHHTAPRSLLWRITSRRCTDSGPRSR